MGKNRSKISFIFSQPIVVYLQLAIFLKTMSAKGKVLVAMSGGIDSTVTALMLHDGGYEVAWPVALLI